MIKRYDKTGRDVTDLPGLWDESDIEICATNYRHPTITSGQHTNGPERYWVRFEGVDWFELKEHRSLHAILRDWKEYGKDLFLALRDEE